MTLDQPLKLDSQSRTTMAGFGYSNDDPANSHDRTPTDLSYIDLAFAGQASFLEARLKGERGEARSEVEAELESLRETIEQRRLRTQRFHIGVGRRRSQEVGVEGVLLAWLVVSLGLTPLASEAFLGLELGSLALALMSGAALVIALTLTVDLDPDSYYDFTD